MPQISLRWEAPPSSFSMLWPRCEVALEAIRSELFVDPGSLTRAQLVEDIHPTEYFHCRWEARLTSSSFELVGVTESGGDWRDYMTSGDLGEVLISVDSAGLQLRLRFSVGQPLQVEILSGSLSSEALAQLADKLTRALNTNH